MAKYLLSLTSRGKRLLESDTFRTILQVMFGIGIFAILYLFLMAGFALGMDM